MRTHCNGQFALITWRRLNKSDRIDDREELIGHSGGNENRAADAVILLVVFDQPIVRIDTCDKRECSRALQRQRERQTTRGRTCSKVRDRRAAQELPINRIAIEVDRDIFKALATTTLGDQKANREG